jgi:alanine racemase
MNNPDRYHAPQALRSWIELSASAFAYNIENIKRVTRSHYLAAIVKSQAYGHGLKAISTLAENNSAIHMLCTVYLSEAYFLRQAGITKPLLTLGPLDEPIERALGNDIHIGIYSYKMLELVTRRAQQRNQLPVVHLKIDTGMSRLGIRPEEITFFLRNHNQFPCVVAGVFTHLADKDNPDQTFTHRQLERFINVVYKLKSHGYDIPYVHALSSGSLHLCDAYPELTMARVGTHCYGFFTSHTSRLHMQQKDRAFNLLPVLTWKSRLLSIKRIPAGATVGYARTYTAPTSTLIGIVPVGYADGLCRTLSNKASVLVNGQPALILGLISMNLIAIDLTDISAALGDEVTLIGTTPGVTAYDRAQEASTIPIEITSRLHPLLPRIIIP